MLTAVVIRVLHLAMTHVGIDRMVNIRNAHLDTERVGDLLARLRQYVTDQNGIAGCSSVCAIRDYDPVQIHPVAPSPQPATHETELGSRPGPPTTRRSHRQMKARPAQETSVVSEPTATQTSKPLKRQRRWEANARDRTFSDAMYTRHAVGTDALIYNTTNAWLDHLHRNKGHASDSPPPK